MDAGAPPAPGHPAPRHVVLVGPTASGKTALALALARRHPDVEIVSVDSMQVYRGMDIGTAKPTAAERAEVPHHLLDVADPHERYTVARYQADARAALAAIEARGHRALLVGGTGLYLRAVTDGLELPGEWPDVRAALEAEPDTAALHARLALLDPLGASRMAPTNRRRVVRALEVTLGSGRPFSSFGPGLAAYPAVPFVQVGLAVDPVVLATRIGRRYRAQLAAGFLEEVRALTADPRGVPRAVRDALGYRELRAHLEGRLTLDDALDAAAARTRRFARRQRAWFRRDPRIRWVAGGVGAQGPGDPRAPGTADGADAAGDALAALEDALARCGRPVGSRR